MSTRIMFGKNNSRARVVKRVNESDYCIEVRAFGHWMLIDRRIFLKPARALAQRLEEAFHTTVKAPPKPKCCVCGTTKNLHEDGWHGHRCNSSKCVPF